VGDDQVKEVEFGKYSWVGVGCCCQNFARSWLVSCKVGMAVLVCPCICCGIPGHCIVALRSLLASEVIDCLFFLVVCLAGHSGSVETSLLRCWGSASD